ncbi:hypothetical protein VA599_00270 [Chromobacterium sp. TRC.1.1.SA]|uniref:Uncharacterized protein n=1 Tax=Chromobacterium indicum TaxID=3110228 RepID=A0ABV0CD82_9NEIS
MIRKFSSVVIALSVAGCIGMPGPELGSPEYKFASQNFSPAIDAEFVFPAQWYPNTAIGTNASLYSPYHDGYLFLNKSIGYFAIYDKNNNRYYSTFKFNKLDIKQTRAEQFGLARFYNIELSDSIHSFNVKPGISASGKQIGRDEIFKQLDEWVSKK